MPPPRHKAPRTVPKIPSTTPSNQSFRFRYLLHQPSISTPTPIPTVEPLSDDDEDDELTSTGNLPASAVEQPIPIYRALFLTRNTFEQILDLGIYRYHLLLAFNPDYVFCAENVCLRALFDALSAKDDARQRRCANSCINLFLPTLRRDYEARVFLGPCSDERRDLYTGRNGPVIRLQVTTTPRQLGLEITTHEVERCYPEEFAVKNMHPNVLTFDRAEVKLEKEFDRGLHRAEVAGRRCWVKPSHCYYDSDSMRREIEALVKTPRQHAIIQLVGLVTVDGTGPMGEGEEMVDGLVLRARKGKIRQLSGIQICSPVEGWRWKSQVGGAVELLQRGDVVWGRAVPENVMIDRDGNALIIDFSGGPGTDSKEFDMAGLCAIFEFIDRITKDDYEGDKNGGYDKDGNEVEPELYDLDDEELADINAPYW